MKQQTATQAAIPLSGTTSLVTSAEQIAARLLRAVGGETCYLSLVGNAGRTPRLLLSVGDNQRGAVRSQNVAPLLRHTYGRTAPYQVELDGMQALVLPLIAAKRQVGTAVVLFHDSRLADIAQAMATAELAAEALDAARQLVVMQLEAEQVAEQARVREIQVSRNLIRGVIDSIPLGLVLLDIDGIVLAANRALSDRVGLDPTTLVGQHYGGVIGAWGESPADQTFQSGRARRLRRTIQHADGRQTLMEISSFPLLDADDRPRQVVEVWEDITERVSLQTQLVRAEKLAAIGQLAASIAHEVGNPLQAIQGFLSLFLEQCAPETTNRTYLELAEEEIERIVQVISRLRDLYRPHADIVVPVNLNQLAETVLLLTSKQMEQHRIQVRREFDPALPKVACVADQIKQVLLNLMLNATDAMKDGGTLTIRTAIGSDASMIEIAVADTGVGIAPEQLPHLFDGLHTTKERGMGLGLYTSKAIVERHMGRIHAASAIGTGTIFTITLPIEE